MKVIRSSGEARQGNDAVARSDFLALSRRCCNVDFCDLFIVDIG